MSLYICSQCGATNHADYRTLRAKYDDDSGPTCSNCGGLCEGPAGDLSDVPQFEDCDDDPFWRERDAERFERRERLMERM
jgi:DNA-directed RNA polymerase subunit RPC12/RpoP